MIASAQRFNRQFLISEGLPEAFAHWSITEVTGELKCFTNNLSVATARSGSGTVLALGEMLDSSDPWNTNDQIAENLMSSLSSGPLDSGFDRLELAMADLGGRWVVLADLDGQTRLYPDCFGTHSTVYSTGELDKTYIASQPQLIAEACGLKPEYSEQEMRKPRGWGWPGIQTPYRGIKRLLPNFYLDVRRGEEQRFWPGAEAPERASLQTCVESMASTLEVLVTAAAARWNLKVGLTDGYDSRLSLAALVGAGVQNASLITQIRPGMKRPGSPIPRQLAAAAGVSWERAPAEPTAETRTYMETMAADSGGTYTGDVAGAAFGRDVDPSEMLILSHCAQGLKAYYLDRIPGGDPAQIRAWGEPLLERRYHSAGKIAVHELGRWIDTLPEPSWIDHRELFSMELKTGAWLPMKYLALDSVVQVMSLGNCRSFHSQGFAQTAALRSAPHYLMRAILRHLWPDVPDLPFNALP